MSCFEETTFFFGVKSVVDTGRWGGGQTRNVQLQPSFGSVIFHLLGGILRMVFYLAGLESKKYCGAIDAIGHDV